MKPLFMRSRQETRSTSYSSLEACSTTSRRSASNKREQLQHDPELSAISDTSAVPTDGDAEYILEPGRPSTGVEITTLAEPRILQKKATTEQLQHELVEDAFPAFSLPLVYDGLLHPSNTADAIPTARPEGLASFNDHQIMVTKSFSVSEQDTWVTRTQSPS